MSRSVQLHDVYKAVRSGALDEICDWVSSGADLRRDGDGILTAAASSGQTAIVSFLIEQGIRPDFFCPGNSLCAAAANGHDDVVALLIDHNHDAAPLEPALRSAIMSCMPKTVRLLVGCGADPEVAATAYERDTGFIPSRSLRDTRMDDAIDIMFAVAFMSSGRWSLDDVAKHCTTAAKIAFVFQHHPDAVDLLPRLAESLRAVAMDILVAARNDDRVQP